MARTRCSVLLASGSSRPRLALRVQRLLQHSRSGIDSGPRDLDLSCAAGGAKPSSDLRVASVRVRCDCVGVCGVDVSESSTRPQTQGWTHAHPMTFVRAKSHPRQATDPKSSRHWQLRPHEPPIRMVLCDLRDAGVRVRLQLRLRCRRGVTRQSSTLKPRTQAV
eukprot:3934862-Rhodomonas_salina.2